MLVPRGDIEHGGGGGGTTDTTPPTGTATVSSALSTALMLTILAGSDDSGAAPSRSLAIYDTEAHRDARGTTGLLAGYPRAVIPNGSDLFGYAADGLTPSTHYWCYVVYTDAAGNAYYCRFDATTTALGVGTVMTSGVQMLMWDAGDPTHAHTWQLPAAPTISSVGRTDYTDTSFDRPMNTLPAGATAQTEGALGTDWTLEGAGVARTSWRHGGLAGTGYCLYIDSTNLVGDGTERVYVKEAAEVDWSALTGLQFRGLSAGSEFASGYFLNFIFAPDVTGSPGAWTEVPVEFKTPGKFEDVKIPFDGVSVASRQHVRYWGWAVMQKKEFVVYMNQLRSYGALMGDFDYVLQLRKTIADGTPAETLLDSPESAAVRVLSGTAGSKCTVNFSAIPAGYEGLLWRLDVGVFTKYRLVATIAAAATSYEDTTVNLAEESELKAGRCLVPSGCKCVQAYHGRLALADPAAKSLWLSTIGNHALWFDVTPADWMDLKASGLAASLFSEGDGMRLPMGDAWPIVAMAPLGAFTGQDFLGDLLVMTDQQDIRLTGVTQDTFSIGFRRAGGAANAVGWCRLPTGSVARIEPNGQITAVGQDFVRKGLSDALEDTLRVMAGKADWRIGYDYVMERLLVSCETGDDSRRAYVLDSVHRGTKEHPVSGWDEWLPDAHGLPTAIIVRGEGDGAHLALGTGLRLQRWMDPSVTPADITAVIVKVIVDGVLVHTLAPLSGKWRYIKKAHGQTVALQVEAGEMVWRSADWNKPGCEMQAEEVRVMWDATGVSSLDVKLQVFSG